MLENACITLKLLDFEKNKTERNALSAIVSFIFDWEKNIIKRNFDGKPAKIYRC